MLYFPLSIITVASFLLQRISAEPPDPLDPRAYIPPASNGGSQLDSSSGSGEPLNIIISGLSSPQVLTTPGVILWANSINFARECLGFHIGDLQQANLGDGRGWVNETSVIRADYGSSFFGTCIESLIGGNHFRFWQQTTTNAIFLAASIELGVEENHNIVPNGYDLGRDQLVAEATAGPTHFNGITYKTTVEWVTGLLMPGSQGINHGIAIDGRVAVLTILTEGAVGDQHSEQFSLVVRFILLLLFPH